MKRVAVAWLAVTMGALFARADILPPKPDAPEAAARRPSIYVITVHEEIAEPTLYVIRKAVKEAEATHADFVVLDMDTLGGSLGATLEIMEILEHFKGHTATYVNGKALSAGSFISAATNDIYFAPRGVIGAAAPVDSSGKDIDVTMKQKVVSFLRARIRAISEEHPYRGEVISAMADDNYELKIGDVVIKPKGELLSLTATEAMKEYGDPPRPLLGAGIVEGLPALYRKLAGTDDHVVHTYTPTWSEKLAQWLTMLSPLLLAVGGLLLFIEFKTPGFGAFGIAGIACLLVVFFGHYVAGLSGHEPMLVFLLGAVLVFVELFFFPGVVVLAVTGAALMLGSLVWGMTDIWPSEPFTLSPEMFVKPLTNLSLGVVLAVVFAVLLVRYLPRGWFWDRLVVGATVSGQAQASGSAPGGASSVVTLVGRRGVAATALRPGGQVEIDGHRYEARCEIDAIDAGAAVVVRGRTDFGLIVEKAES